MYHFPILNQKLETLRVKSYKDLYCVLYHLYCMLMIIICKVCNKLYIVLFADDTNVLLSMDSI